MDCVRVMFHVLEKDEYVDDLLRHLNDHPGWIEEVVFFTTAYHCASRLEEIRPVVERMPRAFERIRAAGYRVGINHLTTTGHHDENLAIAADASLQRQVGLDGQVCQGALCPADPAVLEYVRKAYELFAGVQPDILWIDDDVRYGGHMPTCGTCLCERCVKEFSEEMGEAFIHASLVAAFDDPDFERRSEVRRRFMERNTRVTRDLFVLIEQTVHAISPKTELGFMTGDRFWEGYGFETWTDALRGKSDLPVRWRPGGGFYTDERPIDLVGKVHDVGRQCSRLPDEVTVVQAEVENFPYQPLRKARQSNALEMAGYLLAGCTGNALNILGEDPTMLHEHAPLLDHLHDCVPFWTELKAALVDTELVGLWPAWDGMQIAAGGAKQAESFFHDIMQAMYDPYSLSGLGVPVCYSSSGATVAAFSGTMPLSMGAERMKTFLAAGVLLDATAVQSLEEMGLADHAGVKIGRGYDMDTVERFSDHVMNGSFSGAYRDCRQSFNKVRACELLPRSESLEVLAHMTDYQGRPRGASVTCFENTLGGRVAVMSYFPWSLHQGLAKREQILSICDWLSRETMPLRIHTLARIFPWVRRSSTGALVIGLLNLSADTYDEVRLAVNTERTTFRRLKMDGVSSTLQSTPTKTGRNIILTDFQPFSFEVLRTERT